MKEIDESWKVESKDSENAVGESLGYAINNKPEVCMWSGMMQGKSITEGGTMQGNKSLNEKRIHPTQKPVALYDWIFKNYAEPGQKVLDTHLGSGSSRIAAYEAGLDFIGFEIDPFYFQLEEERFSEYTSQTSLFHMEEKKK